MPASGADDPTDIIKRVFAPDLLTDKSVLAPSPGYCGVEISALVGDLWPQLSPALRSRIPDLYRPVEFRSADQTSHYGEDICDLFLDSTHFRIHYSSDPDHQPPGYPDLQKVNDLADHLEVAYAHHRDESGMGVVLPDGGVGGGTDLIDCYFINLGDALYGSAHWGDDVPTSCVYSSTGFMYITTTFESFDNPDQDRLTSEHEYYHLLQYAHNPHQYSWFMESTARNSEFHVWPDMATPRGSRQWMQLPYYSLWDGSGFHRYAPHFWFYLEAHHGGDFVTRLWDRSCDGSNTTTILKAEIEAMGTDLDATLTDFAIWNYFTGWRDDGNHYNPDYNLPAVYYQASYENYPIVPTSLASRTAAAGGSNYVRFNGPAAANNLQFNFDGTPEAAALRTVTLLGMNDWGHDAWTMTPDNNGDVEFVVNDWGLYEHVVMIVTNFWDAPRDSALLHYSYAASEIAGSATVDDQAKLVSSAPNPFTDFTRVVYVANQGSAPARVRVYNLAGQLVRTLTDESVFEGSHQVVWDGNDQAGRRVPTGMYFVRLENGTSEQVRKVMFVR